MTAPTQITPGQMFGKLKMLEEVERGKHGERRWSTRCECGTRKVYRLGHITQGRVTSCGAASCRDAEKYRSPSAAMGEQRRTFERMHGKECSVCFERKPLSEFPRKYNWYSSHCKSCTILKNRNKHMKRKGRTEYVPPQAPPKIERTSGFPGEKYNHLTIVSEAEPQKGKRRVLCRCDCGGELTVLLQNIRNNNTKSCGCIVRGQGAHTREARKREREIQRGPWARS